MINCLKKFNAIATTDNSDLIKKAYYDTKIGEKKTTDHDESSKNITTQEFNKLTRKYYTEISTSKLKN